MRFEFSSFRPLPENQLITAAHSPHRDTVPAIVTDFLTLRTVKGYKFMSLFI
ncbi:hypothetical protein [Solibacillus isronensis]|uniref:hypothetical protein n=1 Tax=Solibacillus isronensis TaxID=412383 RepID=UPI0039A248A2